MQDSSLCNPSAPVSPSSQRPAVVCLDVYRFDAALPPAKRIERCAQKTPVGQSLPGSAFFVEKEPSGKPFFPNAPALFLSITHSGDYWACAVSSSAVGIDLERPRKCSRDGIERRFFHPDERAFLKGRDDADFFSVWTAKESFVKLSGTGITREFSSFSVVSGGELAASTAGVFFYHLSTLFPYQLCVAAREEAQILVSLCF